MSFTLSSAAPIMVVGHEKKISAESGIEARNWGDGRNFASVAYRKQN